MIIRSLIWCCNAHVEVATLTVVNTNQELIRRMEEKVKAAIDRVWGA